MCAVAFVGIALSLVSTVNSIEKDEIFKELWQITAGIGVGSATNRHTVQPYSYVNSPRENVLPLGMATNKPKEESKSENTEQEKDDPEEPPFVPEIQGHPVVSLDMSEQQTKDRLLCKNESKYSVDVNQYAKSEYPLKLSVPASAPNTETPVILIIHSHGTECYLEEGQKYYDSSTPTRSHDKEKNVVAVGKTLADTLNGLGIPTLHVDIMFDEKSYSDSYSLSEKAVMEYIEKYPSIQYVFDVHRDSVVRENSENIKPLTLIDNLPTAQAMFVVGTDSKGANHPQWTTNLTVASIFQYRLTEKYGNLMRPINIRAASFNAEHAAGSLLIEIGTCGNTLSEAKNCAVLLGQTIAEIILNDGL